jgi:hypothetical protein
VTSMVSVPPLPLADRGNGAHPLLRRLEPLAGS